MLDTYFSSWFNGWFGAWFGDEAAANEKAADNTLVFIQTLDFVLVSAGRSVTDTIAFSQTGSFSLIVGRSVTDTIAFSQTANFLLSGVVAGSAENTLTLGQTASFFLISEVYQVSHLLAFVDAASARGYLDDSDVLELVHSASFRVGIPPGGYFLTDNLNLTDVARRAQTFAITDTLSLVGSGARITPAVSRIAFTQAVRFSKGRIVLDTLLLTQTMSLEARYRRSILHDGLLQQASGYYVGGRASQCNYSRFEGVGTDLGIPTKSRTSNHIPVSFESMSGTPSPVFIRAPEMDDKHRMSFDRVNRETRGGELIVFRDTAWPTTRSMLFTVVGIKNAVFESLQAFMSATLGQTVLFHDWMGLTWQGIVTNPGETATEDRDGYWTVAFEFEGEPYAGPPANHSLAFSQTASFMIG